MTYFHEGKSSGAAKKTPRSDGCLYLQTASGRGQDQPDQRLAKL